MRLTREALVQAADAGILNSEQADALWHYLSQRPETRTSRFDSAHVLWHLGGLVLLAAMAALAAILGDQFGEHVLTWVALAYGLIFLASGHALHRSERMRTAGDILLVLAVATTSLVAYGLLGVSDGSDEDWRSLVVIGAPLVAGLVAALVYRAPLLALPIASSFWALAVQAGELARPDLDTYIPVSMACGLVLMVAGWVLDLRSRAASAGWLHLVGAIAMLVGLTFWAEGPVRQTVYCALNLLILAFGVFIQRRAYAATAALGICWYLGFMAFELFEDSLMFPLALTAIGLLVIGCGLYWRSRQAAISMWLQSWLPAWLIALRPVATRNSD